MSVAFALLLKPRYSLRNLLAIGLSPLSVVGLLGLLEINDPESCGCSMGHPVIEAITATVMYSLIAYACSAVPAGVVVGLMAWRRWPAAFSTIAPLFALASAGAGVLAAMAMLVSKPHDETVQAIVSGLAIFGLLAAAASLPVSLTYCLIAGAPWRPPRPAPADPAMFD